MKIKFALLVLMSFMFFNTYAQETQVFKSKDKESGLVNVLTVTTNSDGSIVVNRSTETNTEVIEVAAYNIAALTQERDFYWMISFTNGVAAKASGPITISCDCDELEEPTGKSCDEEFNTNTGKVTCKPNHCRDCDMTISTSAQEYPNTGGYLIIEATSVTIED